jgi:MbtH protein
MTNPPGIADTGYHVLVNADGEYTLWRAFLAVPDGWVVSLRVDNRQAALDHIAEQLAEPFQRPS